ncbi:MAG: AsmA-like C-terminal domain-containing protein [Roseibium sp.]|uniref:AsmA-like C-terminal domain-containing protein n=1 Tax=Roseibium sp. TaxID=1936156 RepID=UPI0032640E93
MGRRNQANKAENVSNSWLRRTLVASLFLLLLGFCIIVYAILSGPVHVPMLAHFMAEQASQGPAKLSIVDASLDFTHDDGIRVVVRDAHLQLEGDVPVEIILPRVEAPLNGRSLLTGEIHFVSLQLDRPKIILGVPESERELPEMAHLMEAIDRVADVVDSEFARRNLARVHVANGDLEITGALARSFNGIDAEITRRDDHRIDATARVAGRVGPWEIQLMRRPADRDTEQRRLAVLFKDVTLGDFLSPDSELKSGKGMGLPLSARFDSRFDENGKFLSANLVGRINDGWFQMGRTSVRFDDVALSLEWLPEVPGIRIGTSHIIYGNTQIFYDGHIQPPLKPGDDWDLTLATERAQFGSSDVPLAPIAIDTFQLAGRFVPDERTFFFDKAGLAAGPAQLFASGSVEIRSDGPYLALALEGEDLPIGLAKQVWPITLVPPARRWVIDRVLDGHVDHVTFQGAVRPPAFNPANPDPGWSGDDLGLELSFSGAEIQPVGDVPNVSGISGTVSIANEVLTVNGQDGVSSVEGGGIVAVPEATFKILRLRERDNKLGVLDIKLDGEAKDIAEIIDSDPFHVMQRAEVETDGISDEGAMRVEAEFGLRKKIDVADIMWRAQATSKNFSSSKPIKGHKIERANVEVDADQTQIAIVGKGVLDGLPADINLLLPLGGSDVQARQGVVLDVTADQLKARGVDLTAFLKGSMLMTVEDVDGVKTFDVDLTKTSIRLDALGWEKASGVPAAATFRLIETDAERRVQDFELVSDGVDVTGTMTLSLDGDLQRASFSRFQLRSGDDASLTITRGSDGRFKIAMAGEEFDARGLIREVGKPKSGAGTSDFSKGLAVTANLARVTGFNGVGIEKFSGVIETDAKGLTSADVTGLLNGRAPFSFEINDASSGSGRVAEGVFEDSGALLKFLDVYQRMRGGRGSLDVAMADHTTWDGTFNVTGLSITEDPAIRKLTEQRNLLQRRQQGSVVIATGGGGVGEASFDTLDIAFTRSGQTLTISKGGLKGAVIGGTVSGTVDLTSQTMDLNGTFVPIYALNNIFANIPLLGFALGGSSGEGLIGVTYRLSGELSDPVLSVNPISAIAPGIFRKMFEFQ